MRKTLTLLLILALALCLAVGVAACEDRSRQIRSLSALNTDGYAFDMLDLGDFSYKSSLEQDGKYPDVGIVGFKLTYEDGSSSAVAVNDSTLKLKEIKLNGEVVEEEPELYDVGYWEYVFDYDGHTATVYFNILPSTEANYRLTGIPSSWKYSAMPDLTQNISVEGYGDPLVFDGENANVSIYYISAARYSQYVIPGKLNSDILHANIADFSLYQASDDYYIPVGEYLFVAEMKACGNYDTQLTDTVTVTVEKEPLTFTPPENVVAEYYFAGNRQPGNVTISKVSVPACSVTTTNLGGDVLYLQSVYRSWLNPDEEVSVATPDKTYEFTFEPINVDASNYDLSALVGECTVNAHKGYLGSGNDEFIFGDDLPLVVNKSVEINYYNEYGLDFFNSSSLTDDMYKIVEFFSMVDVRDANGKKLPVYSSASNDKPEIEGDEGASAKVVRTYSNIGVYDYFIVLNDAAEYKDYAFTVSLIDDVNFRWGSYGKDCGSEPITLNYTVERNDNYQNFQYNQVSLVDGKFTFDLYMDFEAYDPSLLGTLAVTLTDSYTDENGTTVTTTEGVTMDCEALEAVADESDPDMFKITVSVPVTLPAEDHTYYFVCMKIEMQTADNYKDVNLSAFATLQKN